MERLAGEWPAACALSATQLNLGASQSGTLRHKLRCAVTSPDENEIAPNAVPGRYWLSVGNVELGGISIRPVLACTIVESA